MSIHGVRSHLRCCPPRGAAQETIAELARLNDVYFDKYGYIFIVCATGKSAEVSRSWWVGLDGLDLDRHIYRLGGRIQSLALFVR
jgi:hypothetical protein